MIRRNKHPESPLWETPEGERWMRLMVIAATYHFGLGCGVGAGKLSDFFHMIRIRSPAPGFFVLQGESAQFTLW